MPQTKLSKKGLYVNLVTLLVMGLIMSVGLCWLIYEHNKTSALSTVVLEHEAKLTRAQILFSKAIGDMTHSIELLHQVTPLSIQDSENQANAGELFRSFIISVDSLMQVRWLDKDGNEKVRVNSTAGQPEIVEQSQLQSKANRYYFQRGFAAPEGEIYLSQLDLNVERGQVEIPYRPTIRVLKKTGENNRLPDGLLVLNYDIGPLIESIRALSTAKIDLQIIDSRGFWVLNNDRSLEWGDSLGTPLHNAQKKNPALWDAIKTKQRGEAFINGTGLIDFSCQNLATQYLDSASYTDEAAICFIAVTPESYIDSLKLKALWPAIAIAMIVFIIGLIVLYRERRSGLTVMRLFDELAKDKDKLEDLAERRQKLLTQQQLLQDSLVESRKLSALGMMVAGVAHELNTPIGAAVMATSKQRVEHDKLKQAVESGLTKSALTRFIVSNEQGLDIVEQNQRRAASLVKSFKRLAIDRVKEDYVEYQLRQVVEDLINSVHHRLKHANVATVCEMDDITMFGLPGVVSQVIQNLLANAVHHAFPEPYGGKVTITAVEDNDKVELRITDNGLGIPDDILNNIYDPFVTSKRTQGNTGLGMHFVHQWVTEKLMGTIKIETALNVGTTFIIRFPQKLVNEE